MSTDSLEFVDAEMKIEQSENLKTLPVLLNFENCFENGSLNLERLSPLKGYVNNELYEITSEPSIADSCFDITIEEELSDSDEYDSSCNYVDRITFEQSDVKCEQVMTDCILKYETEETKISCNDETNLSNSPTEDISSRHKLYKCLFCVQRFTNKKDLEQHKSIHLKCQDCDKTFVTRQNLKVHQMSKHLNVRPHKCPDCDKSFIEKRHLKRHQDTVHYKLKPHKCLDCEKSYCEKAEVKRHQMSQHLNIKHKCQDCDKYFVQMSGLKRHQELVHHKQKLFNCSLCNKSYYEKTELKKHQMSSHSKIRPFKCSECDESFPQKVNLKYHQDAVHWYLKPHKCSDCDKRYIRKGELSKHCMSQYVKTKPHKCPDCSKCFTQKHNPKNHQLNHANDNSRTQKGIVIQYERKKTIRKVEREVNRRS